MGWQSILCKVYIPSDRMQLCSQIRYKFNMYFKQVSVKAASLSYISKRNIYLRADIEGSA